MFEFTLSAQDGKARTGRFTTPHGVIQTPVFMPVGTHGAVKSTSPEELQQIGSQIILANTYHMYLRPGDEVVAQLGDLHGFMQWDGPILTDSGGFQVFSLGERAINGRERTAMRTVSEEGITFQSHLDGARHLFTPEKSIQIQQNLGADIIMAFDQPVYGLSDETTTREAVARTHRWLERSAEQWRRGDTEKQALFGIVQGGTHTGLHTESAQFIIEQNLPGNAIGGLAVGESKHDMWAATDSICNLLPENKPRYFMGLGDPLDIIEATARGVDMYDCVAPSRLARHGVIWQPIASEEMLRAFWSSDTETLLNLNQEISSERWNLHNAKFTTDARPLVEVPTSLPTSLQPFSRGTLRHYLKENEMLGYRILTLHNSAVLHQITLHMRASIAQKRFSALAKVFKVAA